MIETTIESTYISLDITSERSPMADNLAKKVWMGNLVCVLFGSSLETIC